MRMMKKLLLCSLFCALSFLSTAQTGTYSIPYSFTLTESGRTSAGVFSDDGTLLRTLWNNVEYKAGTIKKEWDGLDDEGNLVANATYKIVVQTNNVKYEWEGARIGNTSDDLLGFKKHRAFSPVSGMAISGNFAYYCTAFNEGTSSLHKFALDNKQVITRILSMQGHQISATHVATDGKIVYWAGFDSWSSGTWPAFVVGTNVSDDAEVKFESGQSVTMKQGRTYERAINIDRAAKVSGMAVMKNSNYLFVSHGTANQIRVLNKLTGGLIRTINITSPGNLLIDRTDKYIWIMSNLNSVQKHPINADGSLGSPVVVLIGPVKPLAFDISPDNSTIVVSDANNGDEKVKGYSSMTGKELWSMGGGSYEQNPNVANDKFYFINRNSAQGEFRTFVSFEPNGTFWIGDTGNYRLQHYSNSRQYIDRIMFLRNSYNVAADLNNPTKVFNEYMEFKIDYSKPLGNNNGSWELVRNYRAILKTEMFGKDELRRIFKSVATLKNGRTYATVRKNNNYAVVELPENAPMRFTGIEVTKGGILIVKDGSLRSYTNRNEPNLASFYTQDLTGFDALNNPIWGPKYALAELPVKRTDPHDFSQNRNGQITKSGLLISFNKNAYDGDTGYHLGAIKLGDDKWLWKTSKSTSKTYKGDFPTDGTFDIGNGVTSHSAGAGLFVEDNNILWNYNGEFWKNAQTNYWNHFTDKGLMVAQFGTWRDEIGNLSRAPAMMAGNAFSGQVVKVGENLYVYQNDESQHSGIHRWKISGLNTIKDISFPIEVSIKGKGLLGQYYEGKNLDNTQIKTARVDSVINFNWAKEKPQGTDLSTPNNFSVAWSGFVSPLYSETYSFYAKADDGVSLWVDGKMLINSWKDRTSPVETAGTIDLIAGRRYAIELKYYEKDANASIGLLWQSKSQLKEVIPARQLTPNAVDSSDQGIDLMAHLSRDEILQNGLYGWSRNHMFQDSTAYYSKWWSVTTGTKTYKSPDVTAVFRQPENTAYTVSRNLGNVSEKTSEWNLSGNISYEGNYHNTYAGGSYFEVLDDMGKIICRIFTYSGGNTALFLNTPKQYIMQGTGATIDAILENYQFLSIQGKAGNLTVKYGSNPPLSSAVFDPASNWRKPKTLRLYFFTGSKNSARTISLEGFKFKKTDRTSSEPVIKKNQTLTVPELGLRSYNEEFEINGGVSSSGLEVYYVVKSGPATITGNMIKLTGIGTVVIQASQPGNESFNPATSVERSFIVQKANQIITFATISDQSSLVKTLSLSGTASSALPVSYKIISGPATVTGSLITISGAGKITVEANQAGNTNYLPAIAVTRTFLVGKTAQTISFNEISSKTAADLEFSLIASSTSKLPISFRIVSGLASVSGSTVKLTGAGSVTIEATQSGNETFAPAEPVTRTFLVGKSSQTITFNPLENKQASDATFALTATSTSGLPVTFTVVSGPATISGAKVTLTGEGSVTIEASQAGNIIYTAASPVKRTFTVNLTGTVNKTNQSISFPNIAYATTNPAVYTLKATATSGLPVIFRVKSGPASVSGEEVKILGISTIVIEATQAGNEKYNPAPVVSRTFSPGSTAGLTIVKLKQAINFSAIGNQTFGQRLSLAAIASSGLPITFKLVSGSASLSGNSLNINGTGTYVVEAGQSGNNQYEAAAPVRQSFLVSKASQTITISAIPNQTMGAGSLSLNAIASSQLPVNYELISGPGELFGTSIKFTGSGKVTIIASQPGNVNFEPATQVKQSFTVTEGGNGGTKPGTVAVAEMIVYPNPASVYTTVEYTIDETSNVGIIVYNLQGRMLFSKDMGKIEAGVPQRLPVDVSSVDEGQYVLKLTYGKKKAITKSLLVKR